MRVDNPELMVRNSERNTFARCRQRWQWAYRDYLTPRNVKPALRFGDLIHQALAAYYKPSRILTKVVRGPNPVGVFTDLYDKQLEIYTDFGMKTEEDEWVNARDMGIEMLTNYMEQYGRDDRYVVIKPEVPFEVELYDGEEFVCNFVGQFDAVIYDRHNGKYGLFEHKTAKTIKTAHLSMDEQAGSYWAFAPAWFGSKGLPELDFVLYNFLRKGSKDDRPQNEKGQYLNKDGTVSKRQPSPLFHREVVRRSKASSQSVIDRVVQQAKEMHMIDEGILEPIKSITSDCTWQCDFFDMCELHERGADWQEYRRLEMTTWDPYEAHYIGGTEEESA